FAEDQLVVDSGFFFGYGEWLVGWEKLRDKQRVPFNSNTCVSPGGRSTRKARSVPNRAAPPCSTRTLGASRSRICFKCPAHFSTMGRVGSPPELTRPSFPGLVAE